jgi:hypothetical protein
MGEAKRRRQLQQTAATTVYHHTGALQAEGERKIEGKLRADNQRALERELKEMHAEGQGIFQIELITPLNVGHLMGKALAGDAAAGRVMVAFAEFLRRVVSTRPATLCLLCDTAFAPGAPPITGVLMTAHRDEPNTGVWNGLCLGCSKKSGLEELICTYYRENAISDLRRLPAFSEAGRT